jgi:DNA repair protein RadC
MNDSHPYTLPGMADGAAWTVAELSPEQRPAARIHTDGPAALTDAELVSLLLGESRKRNAQPPELQARGLLAAAGGLAGLSVRDRGDLRAAFGEAPAGRLLAAMELGVRMARAAMPDRLPLGDPEAVARYLILRYAERDQEVMGAVYLDVRNRLLGESEVYRGTLARAAVEPRAILKQALLRSAAGMLIFHNHPSGDPSPSAEDLAFTRRLADAGELLGVRLLDHLVIGTGGRWVSLRRRGGW